jgi:transcriptional regulator with XRE-family HTH domain
MPNAPVSLPFSGAKLREVRERAGVSRPQLATRSAELGYPVSSQHIGRLENGKSRPTAPTLKGLQLGLGVALDDLLDPIDTRESNEQVSA